MCSKLVQIVIANGAMTEKEISSFADSHRFLSYFLPIRNILNRCTEKSSHLFLVQSKKRTHKISDPPHPPWKLYWPSMALKAKWPIVLQFLITSLLLQFNSSVKKTYRMTVHAWCCSTWLVSKCCLILTAPSPICLSSFCHPFSATIAWSILTQQTYCAPICIHQHGYLDMRSPNWQSSSSSLFVPVRLVIVLWFYSITSDFNFHFQLYSKSVILINSLM